MKPEDSKSIFVTYHTKGKLAGLYSINTSSLANPFCQKRPTPICEHCYAQQLEGYRANLRNRYAENGELLSGSVPLCCLPRFPAGSYVRFNSFGELLNEHHLDNLITIAKLNKDSTFALWTKRLDLFPKVFHKPENLIVVYSWGDLNPDTRAIKPPRRFIDHIFTVHTEMPREGINCQKHCASCLLCYRRDTDFIIRESLRIGGKEVIRNDIQ